MSRILGIDLGQGEVQFLAERAQARGVEHLQGRGVQLRMTLNHKYTLYAARVMCAALEVEDYAIVTLMEYALYGTSLSSITMAELADRMIALQKRAKKAGDKKMMIVLKAAAANAAR